MIQKIKVIAESFPSKGKVIDVEFDDQTGVCNGSNSQNWNNIIEFSGASGNWSPSFKDQAFSNVYEFVVE